MRSTVMIDGRLVPAERATVSIFDRGFLYGDSVFESLRSYGGMPFALEEHLSRLKRSATRVAIELPVNLEVLRSEMLATLAAHGTSRDSYLRLTLTRGIGRSMGLDPDLGNQPLRVIVVTDLAHPPAEIYERGISAITHRVERPSDAAGVADAKIGNYLVAVMATRAARALSAQEALIEDRDGHILEGAASNFFAVFSGVLVTAPESAAILPGITREHTLSLARARNLKLELRPITRQELASADEAFVTSSIREIVPVVSIDGLPVGDGAPGPVTRGLLQAYRAHAAASLARPQSE